MRSTVQDGGSVYSAKWAVVSNVLCVNIYLWTFLMNNTEHCILTVVWTLYINRSLASVVTRHIDLYRVYVEPGTWGSCAWIYSGTGCLRGGFPPNVYVLCMYVTRSVGVLCLDLRRREMPAWMVHSCDVCVIYSDTYVFWVYF